MCLALGCALIPACTHVEYTRSRESGAGIIDPDEYGADSVAFTDYKVNEITWLDPTGAVCGGVTTGLDAVNSAMKARDEAIEKGRSHYTYDYNVYAPVAGTYCGGYYRWGRGGASVRGDFYDFQAQTLREQELSLDDTRMWELGFHAGGNGQFEQAHWLTWSFGFRLGVGRYRWEEEESSRGTLKDYDDPVLFRMPFWGGLGVFPTFARGLGVEAEVGVDPIMLALTSGNHKARNKLDFDARARYQLKLDPVLITIAGGYKRDNLHWGEYWVERYAPYGETSVTVVF